MEKLLDDAIYVIEDHDDLCLALRNLSENLTSENQGFFNGALQKALRGDLSMGDINKLEFLADDNIVKALTKIHLRSSINLMLDKARRV